MSGVIKLLRLGISKGRVTYRYPSERKPVPEGLRGRPEIVFDACIGCGACAHVCPPNALTVEEQEEMWKMKLFFGRCIMCGLCEEVCPVDAVRFSEDYELASTTKEALEVEFQMRRVKCEACGAYFTTERALNYTLSEYGELAYDIDKSLKEMVRLCPECKKTRWGDASADAYRRAKDEQ